MGEIFVRYRHHSVHIWQIYDLSSPDVTVRKSWTFSIFLDNFCLAFFPYQYSIFHLFLLIWNLVWEWERDRERGLLHSASKKKAIIILFSFQYSFPHKSFPTSMSLITLPCQITWIWRSFDLTCSQCSATLF